MSMMYRIWVAAALSAMIAFDASVYTANYWQAVE